MAKNRLKLRDEVVNVNTGTAGQIAGVQRKPACYLVTLADDSLEFWEMDETSKKTKYGRSIRHKNAA